MTGPYPQTAWKERRERMQTITAHARLMDVPDEKAGISLLKKIEWCGRISHRSEESQTEDSWRRFIPAVVIQHGDWSIVEHASATVDFYEAKEQHETLLQFEQNEITGDWSQDLTGVLAYCSEGGEANSGPVFYPSRTGQELEESASGKEMQGWPGSLQSSNPRRPVRILHAYSPNVRSPVRRHGWVYPLLQLRRAAEDVRSHL